MTSRSHLLFVFVMTLFVAGCSGMVRLSEVNDSHKIYRSLTVEQIKEGILEGAEAAGWNAKPLTSESILATYHIRIHTVYVEIYYTDAYYTFIYKSSNGMKMYCTVQDRDMSRNLKVSGRQECPSGIPMFIHGNYEKWVESLNAAIQYSLANI